MNKTGTVLAFAIVIAFAFQCQGCNKSSASSGDERENISHNEGKSNEYPTKQQWKEFSELEGKSSKELEELFGEPYKVTSKTTPSAELSVWHYPYYAVCIAEIDSEGVIVRVFHDPGF